VFNKFPHHTFYWKGIDGTSIFSHFPPADTYVSDGSVEDVLKNVTNNRDKGRTNCSLLLFGEGDGGGGPHLSHVEHLARVQNFEGLPKVKFSTCHDFFKEAEETSSKLMTWEGELYLELHNGTYTTMAEHKYYNRFMETLLRDVEILHYMSFLEHPQADVH
jgi:alpha-mannosidase